MMEVRDAIATRLYLCYMTYVYRKKLSLSTLVLNSRDRPENIWLPKRMHLDKQPYKNQNTKNQP